MVEPTVTGSVRAGEDPADAALTDRTTPAQGQGGNPGIRNPTVTPLALSFASPTALPELPQQSINEASLSHLHPMRRIGYGRAMQAALVPGNNLLAVATSAGIAWFTLPALEPLRFDPLEGHVEGIRFSPDAQFIAVTRGHLVGQPETLLLRSADRSLLAVLNGIDAVFSPDGQTIATVQYQADEEQATTTLWTSADGAKRATLVGSFPVFSPDGKMIATVQNRFGRQPSTILWKSSDGKLLRDLQGRAPAFSPDGQWLATATGASVQVWDLSGSQLARSSATVAKDVQVRGMAFSRDGRQLRIAAEDGLHIWNVSDDSMFSNLAVSGTFGESERVLIDFPRRSEEGTLSGIRLLDAASGKTLYEDDEMAFTNFTVDNERRVVRFSTDALSATLVTLDGLVRLVNLPEGSTRDLSMPDMSRMAFSPDGQSLAVAGVGPQVHLWSTDEGTRKQHLTVAANESLRRVPRTLQFIPDGRGVVVEEAVWHDDDSTSMAVTAWEVMTSSVEMESWSFRPLEAPEKPGGGLGTYHPATNAVAWVDASDRVRLQRSDGVTTGLGMETLTLTEPGPVSALAFHPDGSLLVIGDEFGTVQIIKTERGYLFDTLQVGEGVESLRFSPDGSLLGVHRADGMLLVFRLGEQTPMLTLALATGVPFAFTPDNHLLISGEPEGVACYRLSDGQMLRRLEGGGEEVLINPQQTILAVMHEDMVTLWGVASP
ncbi:MAG: WD40 repeat domain-containing protein [Chloroflexaceae bacterium]|nr:WD40 repeat domain-containing protein [Chloroflexaceae bacterium]